MRRVGFSGLMVLALTSALVVAPVLTGCATAGNPHVAEAIAHAQEAVDHGEMGHAKEIVKHAQVALQHAKMAQEQVSNPHLIEGVSELEEAVAHGSQGHAEVATKHARSAVMHLSEVK